MNREEKRLLQRQGQMEADGSPASRRPDPGRRPQKRQRISIGTFFQEIRDELRQVAWPNRSEMVNYTTVVIFTLVFMISLIYILNYGLGQAIIYMFKR